MGQRLQFGLRDLIYITLLAALGLGWWVDRSQLADHVQAANVRARTALQKLYLEKGGGSELNLLNH